MICRQPASNTKRAFRLPTKKGDSRSKRKTHINGNFNWNPNSNYEQETLALQRTLAVGRKARRGGPVSTVSPRSSIEVASHLNEENDLSEDKATPPAQCSCLRLLRGPPAPEGQRSLKDLIAQQKVRIGKVIDKTSKQNYNIQCYYYKLLVAS